jgi:hypothetical protein
VLAELLLEDMIFSRAGLKAPTWGTREGLLDLKEKRRLEERVEEVEGALLHFMFLKKAIEEALVSMLVRGLLLVRE